MRSKSSILTFLSGEFSTAVVIGIAVITTPLLLHWLGDERYGAFEAATDWFGYVALLELGVDGALRPLLARAWTSRDNQKVETLIASGIQAYSMLAGLMMIAGSFLALIIPRLVSVSAETTSDLRLGCFLAVFGLVTVPLAPFRSLIEAEQKGYLVNAGLLVQSLVITGSSLLLARAGFGIKGQFLAVLVGTGGFSVFVSCAGLRELSSGWSRRFQQIRQSPEWASIWILNRPTLAFNICRQVGLLTDNILIAACLSPAMVVPFFITQRLAALAQRELQGIGNASWVALAELHAQHQIETFNRRVTELTRLVAILAVAALVPIVIYNHSFVALWVGDRCYGGNALTIVAGLNAFLLAIFSLWGWCISGTGQIALMVPGVVVQTIINLTLSVILTIKFGLIGPVLGTLVGFVTISTWYLPCALHRLFSTSVLLLAKAVALPLVSAVPFALALWRLSMTFPPRGWVELGSEMSLAATFYLASWWLVGLSSDERRLWRQRAYSLVPKAA